MTNKIRKSDFNFTFLGRGHYNVQYESPVTGKVWQTNTSDMPLIDATKNEMDPKAKDLNQLKAICKQRNRLW